MKTLYIECKMGAAGDMLTAALYELLDEPQKQDFLRQMNTMFGSDVQVCALPNTVNGISGTHMQVRVLGQEEGHDHSLSHHHNHNADAAHVHAHSSEEHSHMHHDEHTHHEHHTYQSILDQIQKLPLSETVRTHASTVYRLIGEAESAVHGSTLSQIHFHEVGSLDALADVTGCCLILDMIQPEQILVSPIHVGNGTVHCAHGILPVPAPATAELLKGIPYYTGDIQSELCTPTGAALLKHFADGFCDMPVMSVNAIGIGLGTKEFPVLNAVRAFLGDVPTDKHADQIADISCNLDDMTGEALGYCMEQLFSAGALDVFYIPIQMKKNRPGILLHCLCEPENLDSFCQLILRCTTTRGVRYQFFNRKKLSSHFEDVSTAYGTISRKVSEGYGIRKAKYEFEDMKRIASDNNLSIEELVKRLPQY